MRTAFSPEDFELAFLTAQKESQIAFGDGTMYIEHFVEHPRHIEFQILADSHGNVVHLGERDCSIQRNHQKRIEELEADMESPGFWDNPDKSQNAMKELKGLKDAFERYNELETGLDDVKTLIEMAEESNDQSLIPEIEEEITGLEDKMESLRIET